ncbi:MAG TPA: hypothetical protein VHB97_08975, partial [Polyangia bacterium]|nr:hypothetical protein [Polyangia bacterium]
IFGDAGLDAMHHAQGRRSSDGALVSTYFPTAQHGELLSSSPTGVAMVTQALGFLTSFGALLPAP